MGSIILDLPRKIDDLITPRVGSDRIDVTQLMNKRVFFIVTRYLRCVVIIINAHFREMSPKPCTTLGWIEIQCNFNMNFIKITENRVLGDLPKSRQFTPRE